MQLKSPLKSALKYLRNLRHYLHTFHCTVGENTIATIKMRNIFCFMASFLYCFKYSYRSFTLLKALVKSNENLFAIAFKSEKERQLLLSR